MNVFPFSIPLNWRLSHSAYGIRYSNLQFSVANANYKRMKWTKIYRVNILFFIKTKTKLTCSLHIEAIVQRKLEASHLICVLFHMSGASDDIWWLFGCYSVWIFVPTTSQINITEKTCIQIEMLLQITRKDGSHSWLHMLHAIISNKTAFQFFHICSFFSLCLSLSLSHQCFFSSFFSLAFFHPIWKIEICSIVHSPNTARTHTRRRIHAHGYIRSQKTQHRRVTRWSKHYKIAVYW